MRRSTVAAADASSARVLTPRISAAAPSGTTARTAWPRPIRAWAASVREYSPWAWCGRRRRSAGARAGIDPDPRRVEQRHAAALQLLGAPLEQRTRGAGELLAGVDAEHLLRVVVKHRGDRFALFQQVMNRIGDVVLALVVVGLELAQHAQ